MTYLTRDQILDADDVVTLDVEVPEWGGTVRLRRLGATERERFEFAASELNAMTNGKRHSFRALLVSMSAVNEDGSPIFAPADVELLGQKSGVVLDRLFDAARELSRIGMDQVEELEKNSVGGPAAVSSSGSPSL